MSDIFSYSKINTFSNCRELYHINYIQEIRKKNDNIESYLGSCVHYVIEYIYNNKLDTITLDEIIYIYNEYWNEKWHDYIFMPDRSKKPEQYFNLGIECLRIFFKKNIQNNQNFLKNVIGCELKMNFNYQDYNYRGIIDRLDFDPGKEEYTINDYKTSKRVITTKKAQTDLQLGLYLIAIQKKYNTNKPITLKWHFLRYGIEVSVTPDDNDIELIKKKLNHKTEEIKTLSNERDNFFPNETPLCNWCHYWEECTAKITSNPARRIKNASH